MRTYHEYITISGGGAETTYYVDSERQAWGFTKGGMNTYRVDRGSLARWLLCMRNDARATIVRSRIANA